MSILLNSAAASPYLMVVFSQKLAPVGYIILGDYVQGEGESSGAGIFGERDDDEEEGETLPSYTAHVRDRVTNAFLPAGSTMRIVNPYTSTAPHISPTSGSATSTSLPQRPGASPPPHPHAHTPTQRTRLDQC
jgi:hypothetical protein